MALLEVQDLQIRYEPKRHAPVDAVSNVTFAIEPGEFVGLIGESGSGKTTLGMALLRLLQRPGRIAGGTIRFDGTDITTMDQDELRQYRWTDIATVFQSSMNSLNPVVRVEGQFRDAIEYHTELRGEAVLDRIKKLFDMVIIDHKFITAYPHELSGGMKQRVNLALAMAIEPRFVLLDEPTTGLDVVVQHEILENVRTLQAELGFAVLFISHDIGTVLDLSDRILVMYAGKIVEEQQADLLLQDPMHPYSKGLLGSYGDPRDETVRITYIPGRPPDLAHRPTGCSFAPRCPEKITLCTTIEPPLEVIGQGRAACHVAKLQRSDSLAGPDGYDAPEVGPITRVFQGPQFVKSASESYEALGRDPVLTVEDVSKTFVQRRGTTVTRTEAVRNASFVLHRGGVTALVGQSGSGKSTLARMITGVDQPTSGTITFHGPDGDLVVGGIARSAAAGLPQPRADGVPGPVLGAQPGEDPRLHPRPAAGELPGTARSGDAGQGAGAAGDGCAHPGRAVLQPLRLRAVGRAAAAGRHRPGAGRRARADHRRRADLQPGRVDPGRGARAAEQAGARAGRRHPLHHPRPAQRPDAVGRGDRAQRGQVVEQGPSLEVIRNPQDDYTQLLLDAIPNPFEQVTVDRVRRMSRTGPFGVGIVGAGMISDTYLENLTSFPDTTVVAVADLFPEAAQRKAEQFGVRRFGTVEALLADDDIDIVVNLTTPNAHAEIASQAVSAGKHVWNEKPLTVDRASAQALLKAADAAGVRVGCAPDTFLGSGLQHARRLVEEGVIGTPAHRAGAAADHGPGVVASQPGLPLRPRSGAAVRHGPLLPDGDGPDLRAGGRPGGDRVARAGRPGWSGPVHGPARSSR